MRDQALSEADALELLREGKLLMRMHTDKGMRWFVDRGGPVTESTVKRILARPDVQPHDNGLFPGCEHLPPPSSAPGRRRCPLDRRANRSAMTVFWKIQCDARAATYEQWRVPPTYALPKKG
jgi:hypothetical protein